jgi:hypothetical protein
LTEITGLENKDDNNLWAIGILRPRDTILSSYCLHKPIIAFNDFFYYHFIRKMIISKI